MKVQCIHCGKKFHRKGIGPHQFRCKVGAAISRVEAEMPKVREKIFERGEELVKII